MYIPAAGCGGVALSVRVTSRLWGRGLSVRVTSSFPFCSPTRKWFNPPAERICWSWVHICKDKVRYQPTETIIMIIIIIIMIMQIFQNASLMIFLKCFGWQLRGLRASSAADLLYHSLCLSADPLVVETFSSSEITRCCCWQIVVGVFFYGTEMTGWLDLL